MNDIDVENLKTLKQKYIGVRLDEERVHSEYGAFLNHEKGEFELTFSCLEDWSGEEYTYELSGEINSDCTIKKIFAPHCQRLVGDDARGSSYRAKKMDELDYWRVDRKLKELVTEE